MICAVSNRANDKILLARSPRHPEGVMTTLAGFVEAGETFEACVAREVLEETGVRIDEGSVRYLTSQPWPFPQSCMVAFRATADCDRVGLDDELLGRRWDRSAVRPAACPAPSCSGRRAGRLGRSEPGAARASSSSPGIHYVALHQTARQLRYARRAVCTAPEVQHYR